MQERVSDGDDKETDGHMKERLSVNEIKEAGEAGRESQTRSQLARLGNLEQLAGAPGTALTGAQANAIVDATSTDRLFYKWIENTSRKLSRKQDESAASPLMIHAQIPESYTRPLLDSPEGQVHSVTVNFGLFLAPIHINVNF